MNIPSFAIIPTSLKLGPSPIPNLSVPPYKHPALARFFSGELYGVIYMLHVCEHAPYSAYAYLSTHKDEIPLYIAGILDGIAYLHERGIVIRNISDETLRLDVNHHPKLTHWYIFTSTMSGEASKYPLGEVAYLPPEVFLAPHSFTFNVDVWSIGIFIIYLYKGEIPFSKTDPVAAIDQLRQYAKRVDHVDYLEKYLQDIDIPSAAFDFLVYALDPNPHSRPSSARMKHHPFVSTCTSHDIPPLRTWLRAPLLQCDRCDAEDAAEGIEEGTPGIQVQNPLQRFEGAWLDLDDLHYFWLGAGHSAASRLAKHVQTPPPLERLVRVVRLSSLPLRASEGTPEGLADHGKGALLSRAIVNPADPLQKPPPSLVHVPLDALMDHLEAVRRGGADPLLAPLVHRVCTMRRLLSLLPGSAGQLRVASQEGIPARLRPQVWSALLGIGAWYRGRYARIDTASPCKSDHQIQLDIPRCHQYHPFLASRQGHRALLHILRAWVRANPQKAYWQGIDSLAAPFAILYPDDEAMASACLQKLTTDYQGDFYRADNAVPLQTHLTIFHQLVSFCDPALGFHIATQDFHPELYAIPWFLTLFAHVLALDQVSLLWDALLPRPPELSLFVAVAILVEMRDELLAFDFNALILFFSSLPPVDVSRIAAAAVTLFDASPPSLTVPKICPDTPEAPRSLDMLRKEHVPRILVHHALEEDALIVDARVSQLQMHQPIQEAVCVSAKNASEAIPRIKQSIASRTNPLVAIVGAREACIAVSDILLSHHIPRVCIVHGGTLSM